MQRIMKDQEKEGMGAKREQWRDIRVNRKTAI